MLATRSAHAEPESTFTLAWLAPAGCPADSFVTARMQRLLGHAPGSPRDRPVSVRARVEHESSGQYSVRIRVIADSRGERRFEAPTCEQVAKATALIASLAIDPEAVARAEQDDEDLSTPPGSEQPNQSRLSAGTGTSAKRAAPEPAPEVGSPSSPIQLDFGAQAGTELGVLPQPTERLGLTLALTWRRLEVELAGAYGLRQFVAAPGSGAEGAHFQLDTLELRSCGSLLTGTFELDGCGALEGGSFAAEGSGISAPKRARYAWLGAFAGPRLAFHALSRLTLALDLDGGLGLNRPAFQIYGNDPSFVTQPRLLVAAGVLSARLRVW